jgi:hypothetical protein
MTDSQLAAVVDRTERHLRRIVDGVVAAICAEIAVYAKDGPVPVTDLRRSVTDNVRYILSALRDPGAARDFSAPRETGRRRAQQGVPLPEVIRAFRLCFSGVWQQLADEIRDDAGPDVLDTVLTAASAIWQLTDEYALEMTESHRTTTAELLVRRQQRRSALAEALFTGGSGPESWPWEISSLLGLPVNGDLVVVSASTLRVADEGLPGVESRLAEQGITSLWRLTPTRQRGIVALGTGTIDDIVGVLRGIARTRTGVSPVYQALGDTPRALHLAGVAAAAGARGEVTVFSDSPLAGLVAQHSDESMRIVREVLGRVLDLQADERSALLLTARAWFDHGGSAERTGTALYCHPNTIRNRLRRLQELTGRDLADPWQMSEVGAALQAYGLRPGPDR